MEGLYGMGICHASMTSRAFHAHPQQSQNTGKKSIEDGGGVLGCAGVFIIANERNY